LEGRAGGGRKREMSSSDKGGKEEIVELELTFVVVWLWRVQFRRDGDY